MNFRSLLVLAAAVISAALPSGLSAKAPAAGGELAIMRVYSGWRDGASFKRISEYFDGKENTGGETVLRTHAEERSGYYYLLRVRNPGAARPVKVSIDIITSAEAHLVTHVFPAELKAGDNVLQLGLTGADWTNPKANPVAWKLAVTDVDGRVLATEMSYLWEKPAAK